MRANEIRETFLRFFEERGHSRVPSGPIVPDSDPTLMFTNAGMVPFKRVFTGEETRDYTRATSSQKCVRVSGKHDDLENVGRSLGHQTFFEMLGNFSFGDYFKEGAIELAWELLTGPLGLNGDHLVVSVFREDDEAAELWRRIAGLSDDRIYRLDENENFWSMGDTGPCGPCSEIHYDFHKEQGLPLEGDPSDDSGRFLEIWNLVFMQYERDASGTLNPLPKRSIDTGAGLERLSSVIQRVSSNYETDLFVPILGRAEEVSGVGLGEDPEKDVSLRVVADHARAVTALIGDGVLPSNEGRGYVVRRILRRAARHGVLLGLDQPFLFRVVDAVIDEMEGAYPELGERRAFIGERVRRDEERFLETLSKGLALLEEEIRELRSRGDSVLPGETVFRLYDTFGFPVDLTQDIARGEKIGIDLDGFDASMKVQRERARAAWKGSGSDAVDEIYGRIASGFSTEFVGYDGLEAESTVSALLVGGEPVDAARSGDEVEVVVGTTPFYAESGGQVGDVGSIEGPGGRIDVTDTRKPVEGLVVHRGRVVEGELRVDELVRLRVDEGIRRATVRNHSGTHLLHAAIREVVGPQAMQKGSLVAPDRLRFDFTHDAPLTVDEIRQIEDITNRWIESNAAGQVREMAYQDAIQSGAVAIFEEKYGDSVRVISFGDFSTELCGGTHAAATGDIGLLKVVSEGGIAAGVRRIEALTGGGALAHIQRQEETLQSLAARLKTNVPDLEARVDRLLEERRDLERQLEKLRGEMRGATSSDLTDAAREIAGVRVLMNRVAGADGKQLRPLVDELRDKLGSGIVLLAAEKADGVSLALGVTKDLTGRFKAGDLIREVAAVVGGKGGGRPDFAQAGGRDAAKLDEAFARLEALVVAGSE